MGKRRRIMQLIVFASKVRLVLVLHRTTNRMAFKGLQPILPLALPLAFSPSYTHTHTHTERTKPYAEPTLPGLCRDGPISLDNLDAGIDSATHTPLNGVSTNEKRAMISRSTKDICPVRERDLRNRLGTLESDSDVCT